MRGVKKPWPPGNVSPEGQEEQTWRQAEEQFNTDLQQSSERVALARARFDSLEKRHLREVMYQEQGGLCVYCERAVKEERPSPRIDHWRPLSMNPELALHWRNLYLSCATESTCDSRKQSTPLRADLSDLDLPWPVEVEYQRCVGFTSFGEIYVRQDAPLDEIQRKTLTHALGVLHGNVVKDNGILNLNNPALVAARAAALDSERDRLQRDFEGRTASRADRKTRAARLRNDKPLKEFVSIRVRWLERSLKEIR